jgi:hypothetical protein
MSFRELTATVVFIWKLKFFEMGNHVDEDEGTDTPCVAYYVSTFARKYFLLPRLRP